MPVYNWNKSSSFAEAVIRKIPRKIQKEERANTPIYGKQRQSISGWIGLQELPA
jgi:hypothetical protein